VIPSSNVVVGYVGYYFEGTKCQFPGLATEFTEAFSVRADASGRFVFSHRAEKLGREHRLNIYTTSLDARTNSNYACFEFTDSPESRTFPETGQTVAGRFLRFWDDSGGLQVFGYPLNEARNEQNRDTGKTYLTQWFERNRFELHPENAAPYDVLLGRLGADRLAQLGRDWKAEGREPGPRSGECIWFPQTGHNVCNQSPGTDAPGYGFASYWDEMGLEFDGQIDSSDDESLALFGLPLTSERMERNPDGDLVSTQWFERARFEWHETTEGGRILLGRLGAEVRRP